MSNYEAKTKEDKCPFCEIVKGNLKTPGIFWEDADFMAFLAIDPNTEGFSCVIPKEHYNSDIMKMPDDKLKEFIIASKKVSQILEDYFVDVGRIGVIMEGTGINHAHIKLVPMHGTEYLKQGEWRQVLSDKEFWFDEYEGWICSGGGPEVSPEVLRELGKNLLESQEK
jgi:diadenosine tetraphosphate (Ap4A) HIT family hydrolase